MDSSNRTPKSFTTPSGLVFEVKPYLTGGESLDIKLAGSSGMNAETQGLEVGERPNVKLNFADMQRREIHKKVEMVLVSINGKTENLLQEALDLPSFDFDFIFDTIEGILDPKKAK